MKFCMDVISFVSMHPSFLITNHEQYQSGGDWNSRGGNISSVIQTLNLELLCGEKRTTFFRLFFVERVKITVWHLFEVFICSSVWWK